MSTNTVELRAGARPDVSYRGDIDGLRAVAIVVVVAFHSHVAGFSGGFVGVDVFFVISGWLITKQLLEPVGQRRPPQLFMFWARRVRRLIPASALMIVTTFAASFLLLSPLDWESIAQRGVAAALYVSNLLFAWRAGDYFGDSLQTSPFLHTWSLAVEEQFYLVWPLAFVALGKVAAARPAFDARRALLVTMGLILVSSFWLNLRLSAAGSPWAFFSLPTRAWEFAVAGLVVGAVTSRPAFPALQRQVAVVAGASLIAWSVVTFDDTIRFPGVAALAPVTGTLLLLLAGHGLRAGEKGLLDVLEVRPLRVLGQLSYSWYLWHWPCIVLAVAVTYSDTTATRLTAAIGSLGIAALAHYLVENPMRFSPRLRRSTAATFLVGAAATVLCLAMAASLLVHTSRQIDQPPYSDYEAARQSYRNFDCEPRMSASGIQYCEAGAPDGQRTVVLSGDSHANQWAQAFSDAANRLDIRLVVRGTGNCTATPRPDVAPEEEPVARRECAQWLAATDALIVELHADGVVLADATHSRDLAFPDGEDAWQRAAQAQIDRLAASGIVTGIVVDNPLSNDPLLCLARGRSRSDCTPRADEALSGIERYESRERELVSAGEGVPLLDVNDVICDQEVCPIEHAGVWVFAATEHITQEFTLTQSDRVAMLLGQVLDLR